VRVETFQTGGDRNLAYLIADEETLQAAVVDPSYAPLKVVEFANEAGYRITAAFCTHDHHDHTNGNDAFEEATGVRPLLFGDSDPKTGTRVEGGAGFPLGNLRLEILHTPGHTPDSICLLVGDALFTGDTLFVGKVGGTDLGDGARTEYDSLHRVLLKLPDETRIYPGHDVGVAPESTIGHERATNPFLLREDVESFIKLKRNWAEYKKEHGIA
jgi:glyoxylase-like metal-dependent hydrolase (beta-lactamase superfamily II)